MESTGSKASTGTANHRLQQSCTKCRARKIKCDRKDPCSACVLRGCQDECEYARTDEDRFHIGQAKEIENLRKELKRLKRSLEDTPAQQPPQIQSQSQPQLQPQPQPQPQLQSYNPEAGTMPSGAAMAERPNKRRIGEDGEVADLWNPAANSIAVSGMLSYGAVTTIPYAQPEMFQQNYFLPAQQQYYHHEQPPADSNNSNFSNMPTTYPPQYNFHQLQDHPQPDFWRGKQKQLETIYKIVCDCNEYWVPYIIDIVRTSLSPEDAIASIRLLLRSGSSGGSSSSHAHSNNSNDGGTTVARSTTTTTASESRSPDSASSMVPVEGEIAPYSYYDSAMGFWRYLSPTDQSRSSGEG